MIACPPKNDSTLDLLLASARSAQTRWAERPINSRLEIVRELRHRLAENAESLATTAAEVLGRPVAEKLASEVLPLADGCRWLENNAARVLAPQRYGRDGRPLWLQGVRFEVQRQPMGVVLIIGPGNYPLFLPSIQAIQALVAGNAVLLKPAPGTRRVSCEFARLAQESGLDPALLMVLPTSVAIAEKTMDQGVDKVVFTGSSENGRSVLRHLADTATPSVMELSGQDAVVVFADADLDLVIPALSFGTGINNGQTCMAPKRLLAETGIADALRARLADDRALPFETFDNETEALQLLDSSDFALGVSIFSANADAARAFASRVRTGFAVINDIIAPTADPRMPFGGIRASGFGTTRGAEGLLEMTFPHVVMIRNGQSRPHYDELEADNTRLFTSYIQAAHGRERLRAIPNLVSALLDKSKNRKTSS